jgi:hypothetical protein
MSSETRVQRRFQKLINGIKKGIRDPHLIYSLLIMQRELRIARCNTKYCIEMCYADI